VFTALAVLAITAACVWLVGLWSLPMYAVWCAYIFGYYYNRLPAWFHRLEPPCEDFGEGRALGEPRWWDKRPVMIYFVGTTILTVVLLIFHH
jgi:hypothetical protein